MLLSRNSVINPGGVVSPLHSSARAGIVADFSPVRSWPIARCAARASAATISNAVVLRLTSRPRAVETSVPVGWVPLLIDAIAALDRLVRDWRVYRLEERLAGCCLQVILPADAATEVRDAVREITRDLAERSCRICDVCGASADVFAPGHPDWLNTDLDWVTRCEVHLRHPGQQARLTLARTKGTAPWTTTH